MVKGFDRYEILANHYRQQVESWKWDAIKEDALRNPGISEGSGEEQGFSYLGSVFAVMPSGKFWCAFTSNQTRGDMVKDEIFRGVMEETAQKHGLWIENGEGDPCDLFACCSLN